MQNKTLIVGIGTAGANFIERNRTSFLHGAAFEIVTNDTAILFKKVVRYQTVFLVFAATSPTANRFVTDILGKIVGLRKKCFVLAFTPFHDEAPGQKQMAVNLINTMNFTATNSYTVSNGNTWAKAKSGSTREESYPAGDESFTFLINAYLLKGGDILDRPKYVRAGKAREDPRWKM